MRDFLCSSNVKNHLKECRKRSQSSSSSFYYFYMVHKYQRRTEVTNKLPCGNSQEGDEGLLHGGKMLKWGISETQTDKLAWMPPANCAWTAEDCCQDPAESVPTLLQCENFNLLVAVLLCWKLPAEVPTTMWIRIEKPGEAARIFHFSFCLSLVKFHKGLPASKSHRTYRKEVFSMHGQTCIIFHIYLCP